MPPYVYRVMRGSVCPQNEAEQQFLIEVANVLSTRFPPSDKNRWYFVVAENDKEMLRLDAHFATMLGNPGVAGFKFNDRDHGFHFTARSNHPLTEHFVAASIRIRLLAVNSPLIRKAFWLVRCRASVPLLRIKNWIAQDNPFKLRRWIQFVRSSGNHSPFQVYHAPPIVILPDVGPDDAIDVDV
jgi:hypothetical protein